MLNKIKSFPVLKNSENDVRYLNDYINNLNLNEETKNQILDENFIQGNPSYYINYPSLFCDVFSAKGEIKLLHIAGFLYYKSIIYLDELFDNVKSKTNRIILINICQEECIKILSSFFDLKSVFWKIWNQRRQEYLSAYKIDKITQNITSFHDFEKLADYKSAFGKIAIDTLYILSDQNDSHLYNKLLESHKYFYAGFQILDDLEDIKEDIESGQFNIACHQLKIELINRSINYNNQPIDDLTKYIYIFGVANKLIDKCIDYLDKAEEILENYPFDKWKTEIRKLNNTAVIRKLNIQAYIKYLFVKMDLSQEVCRSQSNVIDVINNGVKFIMSGQNEDGSWQEYYNDAGLSDSWATAFILSYLNQNEEIKHFSHSTLNKAHSFINCENEELWGYNKSWIPDADSTTFVLLAEYLKNKKVNNLSLRKWFDFQNKDGGFATYLNPDSVLASLNNDATTNVKGWLSSHICVSASAFYLLSRIKNNSKKYHKLKKFLLSKQNASGLWECYWWTSPIYSSVFMIKSSIYTESKDFQDPITKTIKAVIKLQNKNGSYGDEFVNESPFYTALVIDAFCEDEKLYKHFKKSN